MTNPTFIFEGGVATEIPKGVVSKDARFVFDREVRLKQNDYLRLVDGQFFLVRNGHAQQVEGKWEL
jgi:hypothetical protein